jgi:N4-gp56 family major capsid protein
MAINPILTTDITPSMQTYYDKKLLINAKSNLVHQKFGQKVSLPKNQGKTIQFRKWTPFGAITTPLVEGSVPDGQSLAMTSISAQIDQYGGYVAVSDMLDLTALDPVINDSVELMGDQGGLTMDTLTREVISVSQNVQFAGANTARHNLTSSDKLTVNELRKAVRTLKKNKAPMFSRDGKSYYVAIVGPETTYDLQSDTLWQDAAKYSAVENIFEGEIGKLFGVVFVETSEAKMFTADDLLDASRNMTVDSIASAVITVDEAISADEATALSGVSVVINDEKYTIESSASGAAGAATITLTEAPSSAPSDGDIIYPGDAGAAGSPVASTLVFGKNAYGVIELESGNLHSIIKPKGSAGTSDPLEQISTIGWKVDGFVSKVLQSLWLLRIEHCVSE